VSLQPQTFVTKIRQVQAYQVDSENFAVVAAWCGGEIHVPDANEPEAITVLAGAAIPSPGDATRAFIKLNNARLGNPAWGKAFVGDWVVKQGRTFKKYTDQAFTNSYRPSEGFATLPYTGNPEIVEEIGSTPIYDAVVAELQRSTVTQMPLETVAVNVTKAVKNLPSYDVVEMNANEPVASTAERRELDRSVRFEEGQDVSREVGVQH
jgi:hypothetical protein